MLGMKINFADLLQEIAKIVKTVFQSAYYTDNASSEFQNQIAQPLIMETGVVAWVRYDIHCSSSIEASCFKKRKFIYFSSKTHCFQFRNEQDFRRALEHAEALVHGNH